MTIQAIETQYKGCRFRSRLEARWAIWLDALGIDWSYEPQGFTLDAMRYLPDFFLRSVDQDWDGGNPKGRGYWLEIKPTALDEREEEMLRLLALNSGHVAYAFAGEPWPGEFAVYSARRRHWQGQEDRVTLRVHLPRDCWLCHGVGVRQAMTYFAKTWRGREFHYVGDGPCPTCDGTGDAPPDDLLAHVGQHLFGFQANLLDPIPDPERLAEAFRAARSARFEHGETPR